MVFEPAVAVTVPPVQVPPTFGNAATCSLLGKVSAKLTVCTGLNGAGLVTVNVSVVVAPDAIVVGLNCLLRLGVCWVTVTQLGVTPLTRFVNPLTLVDVLV